MGTLHATLGKAHYFGKNSCHFTYVWLYKTLFPFELHTEKLLTMY